MHSSAPATVHRPVLVKAASICPAPQHPLSGGTTGGSVIRSRSAHPFATGQEMLQSSANVTITCAHLARPATLTSLHSLPLMYVMSRVQTTPLQMSCWYSGCLLYRFLGYGKDSPQPSAYPTLQLQDVAISHTNTTLLCDVSTGKPCPFAPMDWCQQVFDSLHSLSYPGIRATQRLIFSKKSSPLKIVR